MASNQGLQGNSRSVCLLASSETWRLRCIPTHLPSQPLAQVPVIPCRTPESLQSSLVPTPSSRYGLRGAYAGDRSVKIRGGSPRNRNDVGGSETPREQWTIGGGTNGVAKDECVFGSQGLHRTNRQLRTWKAEATEAGG